MPTTRVNQKLSRLIPFSVAQQFLAQRICLESHLGESVFNDIADRNNSDKSTILHHGKMSELSKRHPFHKLQDRITFFAGYDRACHHLFDRFVTNAAAAGSPLGRSAPRGIGMSGA